MVSIEEGWEKMPDGRELYTKSYLPAGPPSATILFIHGFSDHANRYTPFHTLLANSGLAIYAFDQRGWGRSVKSPSERGLTGKTPQVMADITHMVKRHLPSSVPFFVMGHSMGGQETLYWACTAPADLRNQVSGFILSAPYFRLHPSSQPSWLKVRAGRLAAAMVPKMQLKNELDESFLSHSEADNQSWKEDPLCHDMGTLEGLDGMLRRAEELDTGAVRLGKGKEWDDVRVLAFHGDADRITSCEATKLVVGRMEGGERRVRVFEGAFHNLHVEPEHEQVKDEVVAFTQTAKDGEEIPKAQSKL